MMLWVRGVIFTLVAPVLVAGAVPSWIAPERHVRGGAWGLGWLLIGLGAVLYLHCLRRFLAAGGTPAIFFTRPLRAFLGEEPASLVRSGLYRRSRNPMYLGVVLAVAGQAIVFASGAIALYGATLLALFHLVVVSIEEPHLRRERGSEYEDYVRTVPRWLGRARR